jgi:protein involved in sex pheromone biosynthesis
MKKNLLISILITSFFLFSGCQTVKNKTDAIVEKENEKLKQIYWQIIK